MPSWNFYRYFIKSIDQFGEFLRIYFIEFSNLLARYVSINISDNF